MSLNGNSLRGGMRRGGIRKIALIRAGAVSRISFGECGRVVDSVVIVESERFVPYYFREDTALYEETVSYPDGAAVVEHRLSMALGKMDEHTGRAVAELIAGSPEGIVAVITTACRDEIIVGISEKFGADRPLQLCSGAATTGQKPMDDAEETIVLRSCDTDKAAAFNGVI